MKYLKRLIITIKKPEIETFLELMRSLKRSTTTLESVYVYMKNQMRLTDFYDDFFEAVAGEEFRELKELTVAGDRCLMKGSQIISIAAKKREGYLLKFSNFNMKAEDVPQVLAQSKHVMIDIKIEFT